MSRRLWPSNVLFKHLRPEEDAEMVRMFLAHPILFMEQYLKVKNKEQGIMPFILRPDQRLVYELFQLTRSQHRLLRFICLKARQVGISTFIEAWIYTLCRLRPNTQILILAHQNKTSEKIYEIFKTFHENMTEELQPAKKNPRDTISQLKFENGSSIQTATAKNNDPSRGFALNGCHASELPWYENAEETITGIGSGLSKGPESLFVLESTPRGMENYFYDAWDSALREGRLGPEHENWIPIFLAWWMNPTYIMALTPEDHTRSVFTWENLSDRERKIIKTCMPLLPGSDFAEWQRKLKWRRSAVAIDCHYSERIFDQEYPSDPKTCFLASGESIFDMDAIQWFANNTVRRNGRRGKLRISEQGRPFFVEATTWPLHWWKERDVHEWNEANPWTVWEDPHPNRQYALGCDGSMEGRQQAQADITGKSAKDFSAICVMSHGFVQCAEYRKQSIDPIEFAEVVAAAGRWYNEAVVVPEVENGGGNSAGYGIQWRLKQIYPIGRIWKWPAWDAASPVKNSNFVGFVPNEKGEKVFLSVFMRELRRGAGLLKEEDGEVGRYDRDWPRLKIHSEALISELTSYKMSKDGGAGAPKGSHDDLVRAAGLALLGLKDLGPPVDTKNRETMREVVKQLPFDRWGKAPMGPAAGSAAWLLS